MTKKEILKNLYIQTQEFVPAKLNTLRIEFNGFLGQFYYFNSKTGETFFIDEKKARELDITVDEAIEAVNKNTKNDLIVLPLHNNSGFELIDINGAHVEKILLNKKRLRKIFRSQVTTKLFFIPVTYFKWYITDLNISCGNDLTNIFKEKIATTYYFEIKSNGDIYKHHFD